MGRKKRETKEASSEGRSEEEREKKRKFGVKVMAERKEGSKERKHALKERRNEGLVKYKGTNRRIHWRKKKEGKDRRRR